MNKSIEQHRPHPAQYQRYLKKKRSGIHWESAEQWQPKSNMAQDYIRENWSPKTTRNIRVRRNLRSRSSTQSPSQHITAQSLGTANAIRLVTSSQTVYMSPTVQQTSFLIDT